MKVHLFLTPLQLVIRMLQENQGKKTVAMNLILCTIYSPYLLYSFRADYNLYK